jgi:hypothetical protein
MGSSNRARVSLVLVTALGLGSAGCREIRERASRIEADYASRGAKSGEAAEPSVPRVDAPKAAVSAKAPVAAADDAGATKTETVASTPKGASGPLRVLVTGDVIAHRPVLVKEGALAKALEPLGPLFSGADAVLVNHESATGETPRGRELAYAAPAFWSSELHASHVTTVGLANNHACDLGREGLGATVDSAKKAGLAVVGAGEKPWSHVVLAERGAHKVCAVAWSTLENGDPRTCKGMLAYGPEGRPSESLMATALSDAKKAGCDTVVAVVHIGEEYKDQPPSVYALGARLAEAGADAVVMHHPHVPSPLKTTTTKDGRVVPVFASVGNLVSNQGYAWKPPHPVVVSDRKQVSANAWTRIGMIAELEIAYPEGAARPSLRYGYHVVWNDKPKLEKRGEADILARTISRKADAELLARFALDKEGPHAVLASPCWIEEGKLCEGPLGGEARPGQKTARRTKPTN